ncbi:aminotransferase class V-fold PLP-dependent enzyme [Tepidiforma sp.]|uniref:aminotransferase class V-fold PLP-dependent enzyme n=1 Tax=Tepidiforma sp. TaxID=2682230 RepID=UPI002ADDA26D|nr:aminotransferase class V-fold PLP-dependent enzyme [Tepidiforma sp.]
MPDVLSWRKRFPILANKTYLINNSLGAMPDSVPAALAEYTNLWATEGVVAWDTWLPEVARVASILEDIAHAPRGSMTMCQNVTNAVAELLSCLEYEPPQNRIVLCAGEFPTIEYLVHGQRALGAEVVRVGGDPLTFPAEELVEAIDQRTLLVVVSHVLFRTAELVDVRPIIERAHAFGALVLLDVYQSMGAVPFDVTELGVDFMVGGSVKWLCGGPGAGYVYVRPDLVDRLEPRMVGWFSHARPFGFEPPPVDLAPGIARFTGGTPNIPAYYQAREGYRIIREVGVDAIRAKSLHQTTLLIEGALERGFMVRTPLDPARRGNHVTVDLPAADRVKDELIRRGFVVDHRPGAGIRIAPHFFNTDDECVAVLEEMRAIVQGGLPQE